MATVFICYRRDDSAAYAGWLRSVLVEAFGATRVFMDIDAIRPGEDFEQRIQKTLDAADAVLVLIGPRWLEIRSKDAMPRLHDPDDYVRLEIAGALARGAVTIPVLVGGASIPSTAELPEVLKPLIRRHAMELTDQHWGYDTGKLIDVIEKIAAERPAPARVGSIRTTVASGSGEVTSQRVSSLGVGPADPDALDAAGLFPEVNQFIGGTSARVTAAFFGWAASGLVLALVGPLSPAFALLTSGTLAGGSTAVSLNEGASPRRFQSAAAIVLGWSVAVAAAPYLMSPIDDLDFGWFGPPVIVTVSLTASSIWNGHGVVRAIAAALSWVVITLSVAIGAIVFYEEYDSTRPALALTAAILMTGGIGFLGTFASVKILPIRPAGRKSKSDEPSEFDSV
jgi:hypothetical protein